MNRRLEPLSALLPPVVAVLVARHQPQETDMTALACCDEHPFIPGALCRVVGPHDLHDYDGVDPWTPNPNTKD